MEDLGRGPTKSIPITSHGWVGTGSGFNNPTDGCGTGIAGVVSQGADWRTASVAAFFSAKLNSAQQNYPVHEIEMLAGVETMLRHQDILQGVRFNWYMDHKGLIHLLEQKNLSGRQA